MNEYKRLARERKKIEEKEIQESIESEVYGFFEGTVLPSDNKQPLPKSTLYQIYRNYCKRNCVTGVSHKRFSRMFLDYAAPSKGNGWEREVESKRCCVGGKVQWCWIGIEISKEEMRALPCSALTFFRESLRLETCGFILKAELWSRYRDYCKENGVEAVDKATFKETLMAPNVVSDIVMKVNGKAARVWKGIVWR